MNYGERIQRLFSCVGFSKMTETQKMMAAGNLAFEFDDLEKSLTTWQAISDSLPPNDAYVIIVLTGGRKLVAKFRRGQFIWDAHNLPMDSIKWWRLFPAIPSEGKNDT